MIFKFKYQKLGGHTHFRLYVGKTMYSLGLTNSGGNHSPNIMRNEEWKAFRDLLELMNITSYNPDLDLQDNEFIFEETELYRTEDGGLLP